MGPLNELEALIEEARWLGDGEPYEYGQEDPLEELMQRVRGVEPSEPSEPSEPQERPTAAAKGGEKQGGDRLGEVLSARLRERSLGGVEREKAVRMVTELLSDGEDRRLQALWDLLVFGE